MKTKLVFLLWLILPLPVLGFHSPPGIKLSKASIQLVGGQKVYGYLFAITDSSLEISRTGLVSNLNSADRQNLKLPVRNISAIKLRKSQAITGSGVLGGITGLLVGSILGSIAYKPCDPTPGFLGLSECSFKVVDQTGYALIGAGLGAIPGTGIGILIGKHGKKIKIGGSQHLFEQNKIRLAAYLPKNK